MQEAMCELVLKKTEATQKFVCDYNMKGYLERADELTSELVVTTPNEILHFNMDTIKLIYLKGLGLMEPVNVCLSISYKGGKVTNLFVTGTMAESLTKAWQTATQGRHLGLLKAFDPRSALVVHGKDIVYISSHIMRGFTKANNVSDAVENPNKVTFQNGNLQVKELPIKVTVPQEDDEDEYSFRDIVAFVHDHRGQLVFKSEDVTKAKRMNDILTLEKHKDAVDYLDCKRVLTLMIICSDLYNQYRGLRAVMQFAEDWRVSAFVPEDKKTTLKEYLDTIAKFPIHAYSAAAIEHLKTTIKSIISRPSIPNVDPYCTDTVLRTPYPTTREEEETDKPYSRQWPVAKGTADLQKASNRTGTPILRTGIKPERPKGKVYTYHECTCGCFEFVYVDNANDKRVECSKCKKLLTKDAGREKRDGENHAAIVYTSYYMPTSLEGVSK